MKRSAAVVLGASVWIPYLRVRRYAALIDPLVATGRFWVHAVVLLELFAGTQSAVTPALSTQSAPQRRDSGGYTAPRRTTSCWLSLSSVWMSAAW